MRYLLPTVQDALLVMAYGIYPIFTECREGFVVPAFFEVIETGVCKLPDRGRDPGSNSAMDSILHLGLAFNKQWPVWIEADTGKDLDVLIKEMDDEFYGRGK